MGQALHLEKGYIVLKSYQITLIIGNYSDIQKYIDTAIAETIRSSSFACGLIADR